MRSAEWFLSEPEPPAVFEPIPGGYRIVAEFDRLEDGRLCSAAREMADALEKLRMAVWSDCRLPGEMRKDLEALYRNEVLPALRKAGRLEGGLCVSEG